MLNEGGTIDEVKIVRRELVDIYMERFDKAKRGRGFHNCAGFVKYLLGLSDEDGFVRPDDSSKNGLIYYLEPSELLKLEEFNEDDWTKYATDADAVAIFRNTDDRWSYLHFFVPHPDPNRPFDIFQRGDFEADAPDIADIRLIINDPEFAGDSRFVFFKLKART